MDPMDVNVEAGSAARWRRLKISRFNGGSSFTWLPNFFWGFFLVFGFVWLFFFFVLVPAPGARGHETNPIVAVDRRFYSVALSLSLSPTVAFVFQPLRIVCSASNTMAL